MNKTLSLTEGGVVSTLLKFTFPIFLSFILQITYGTIDLLIVGKYATIADVSAVTIASQVMNTITSLCIGLSMGTTILIAQSIGSRKIKKVMKIVNTSLVMFSVLAIFVSVLLLIFNGIIVDLMKTPIESVRQTSSYLFIASIGMLFVIYYNLLGSIFRGIGDSKTPLITVFIACIVNIILDLIFVARFDMGASGAGLATVMAQATSVILSLFIIKKKALFADFSIKKISFEKKYAKKILVLGTPVALQSMLVSLSFLAVTAIINSFGVVTSAAVGIVEKITGLIMSVPFSFMQALSAYTAQNYGAKKYDRAKKAFKYGLSFSLIFGFFTAYLSAFHGEVFTQIFTNDIETTKQALLYLKAYSFDCIFVAIMFSFSGFFSGCGKTSFVMLQSVAGSFLIRIPFAYIFSRLDNANLFIIGLATPIATVLQIVACIIFYKNLMNKQKRLL